MRSKVCKSLILLIQTNFFLPLNSHLYLQSCFPPHTQKKTLSEWKNHKVQKRDENKHNDDDDGWVGEEMRAENIKTNKKEHSITAKTALCMIKSLKVSQRIERRCENSVHQLLHH